MASNLSVSVTADTTDLRTNLALAQADLKKFGAETRQLASAIRAGGDTTGALRGQLQQVAAQFNRAQASAAGLTSNLKAATAAAQQHSAATLAMGASSAGIARITSAIGTVVSSLGAMRSALGPIGGAIAGAFAVQQIVQTTRAIAKLGETTENSADLLGLSVEQFSRMSGAMQIAGADSESATKGIEKLGRSVLDALKDPAGSAAVAFDNLGIKMGTLKAQGNDTEAMLGVLADAWVSHDKGLLRTGAGYELIGRTLDKLVPLLNRGSQGVKELGDAAQKTGSVLSPGMARALAETDDKFDTLGLTIRGAGIATLNLFKPLIDHTVDSITAVIRKFTDWANVIESWALKARIAIFNVRNELYKLTHESGTTMVGPRGLIPDEEGEDFTGNAPVGTRKAGGGGAGKDDRLSEWRDELRQKLQAEQNFFKDSKEDELAFWKEKAAIVQAGTGKEEVKLRREVNAEIFRLQKDLAQQTQRLQLEELDYKIRVAEQEYAGIKARLDGEVSLGKISAEEGIAQERVALNQRIALEDEYTNKKLEAAAQDVETTAKLSRDKFILTQDFVAKVEDLNLKAAEASKAAWEKVFAPLESAFDSAIKGFIQGTTTLYQALSRAGETLFLDPLLKNLTGGLKTAFQGAFGDISGGVVGKFFSGTLLSGVMDTSATAGTTALGVASTTAAAEITAMGVAASAAALELGAAGAAGGGDALFNIFSKVASVPLLFNRGGIVPSAAGGWMVPHTGSGGVLANLHSNEMVLPRNISEGLQAALGGGGAMTSNRSQAINLTYAPSINAPSHMGLEKILARDSRAMTGFISSRVRDGALELPGGWRG